MSETNEAQGSATTTTTPAPAAPSTGAPSAAAPAAQAKPASPSGVAGLKAKAAQAAQAIESAGSASGIENPVDKDPNAPPAFTPNFKFKVDEEEKEIDELFRGIIKDAETEKKVRELHEKALGLDLNKQRTEKVKTELSEVKTKYSNLDNSLKELSGFVRNKDLGSFFEAIQIPKQMVFEYVKKELERMEATPEQRAEMERQEKERRDLYNLQKENADLKERFTNETVQTRGMELDQALASAEIGTMAQKFDAMMGPNAFKLAVIDRGILAYHTTGVSIPVAQAVQETVAKFSKLLQQSPQAPAGGSQEDEHAPESAPAEKPPTMPNVTGRSTSPLKQGPRSIADLKKIGQAMNNQ